MTDVLIAGLGQAPEPKRGGVPDPCNRDGYLYQTSLTTGNLPMGMVERARSLPILRRILEAPVTREQKVAMIQRVPLLVLHLQPEFLKALLDGTISAEGL